MADQSIAATLQAGAQRDPLGDDLPTALPAAGGSDERLNDAYRGAVAAAMAAGIRPADPLNTPLPQARSDALAWHRHWQGALPVVRQVTDLVIAGPAGPLPLRLYRPHLHSGGPLAVYFHGGGFVLNSLATHDRLMREIASRAHVPVLGVGYSLAPKRRFPVQIEEALTCVEWAVRSAPMLGINPDRIALAGDSAGACLALAAACALRDRGNGRPAFLALLYGMFSNDLDTSSHRAFGGAGHMLPTARVRWFWDQYLVGPADHDDPRAVPLLADLRGLPPTLIIAAGLDCLRDDSTRLAARLRAARVPHVLSVYDDLPHGFAILAPAVRRAADALAEATSALACLRRPSGHRRWRARHERVADDRPYLPAGLVPTAEVAGSDLAAVGRRCISIGRPATQGGR